MSNLHCQKKIQIRRVITLHLSIWQDGILFHCVIMKDRGHYSLEFHFTFCDLADFK